MKTYLAVLAATVVGASCTAYAADKPVPATPPKAAPAPQTQAAPAKPVPAKAPPAKSRTEKAAAPKASAKNEKKDAQKSAGQVTVLHDLVYAAWPGFRPMTLDLYQPHRAPKDYPKPLLIFVHGGFWNSGDARHGGGFDDFPALLTQLAQQQDYVVASVNYRLSGEARFPAALQDVKSAIRWLRAHADDYGIDVTRVAIWGEEAGGQLAALTGTSCGVAALEPPRANDQNEPLPSDCVQAVIDWHGVSDVASLAQDSERDGKSPTPEGAYLGCEPAACAPGLVRNASPITFVGPNSPPFLLAHGAHKNVPLAQSQKLFDALNQIHIPVEQATYGETETDVAQKSIDKLKEFLNRVFPRKPSTAGPPPRPRSGPLPY